MTTFNTVLPNAQTYEEYDQLNLNDKIFKNAAHEILAYHHLPNSQIKLLLGTNLVYSCGSSKIIKIFPPAHYDHYLSEILVMKHLYNKLTVNTPKVEHEGEISEWPYIIMNQLEGMLLENLWETFESKDKIIIIRELGALIAEVHALSTQGLETIDSHWAQFINQQMNNCAEHHQSKQLTKSLVKQIPHYLAKSKKSLPNIHKPVILTGEYTPMNILVKQKQDAWHISGLIDFGDAMLGLAQYDLLGPGVFLIQGNKKFLREFLIAYGYSPKDLTKNLSRQLNTLMFLHRYSNLNLQIRIPNWQQKIENISDLENLVWGL